MQVLAHQSHKADPGQTTIEQVADQAGKGGGCFSQRPGWTFPQQQRVQGQWNGNPGEQAEEQTIAQAGCVALRLVTKNSPKSDPPQGQDQ